MEVVRKVLEFDVVVNRESSPKEITKRNWASTRADIEAQLSEIGKSVWDGFSKEEIAKAISKTIYKLTVTASKAGLEELVQEYLQNEHKNPPGESPGGN